MKFVQQLAPVFALVLLFSACDKTEDFHPACEALATQAPARQDDILSLTAAIEDTCLRLNLTYSGGCQAHDFDLYWDGNYGLSLPERVTVQLGHDSHGETCEAVHSAVLYYDLRTVLTGLHAVDQVYVQAAGVPEALATWED